MARLNSVTIGAPAVTYTPVGLAGGVGTLENRVAFSDGAGSNVFAIKRYSVSSNGASLTQRSKSKFTLSVPITTSAACATTVCTDVKVPIKGAVTGIAYIKVEIDLPPRASYPGTDFEWNVAVLNILKDLSNILPESTLSLPAIKGESVF